MLLYSPGPSHNIVKGRSIMTINYSMKGKRRLEMEKISHPPPLKSDFKARQAGAVKAGRLRPPVGVALTAAGDGLRLLRKGGGDDLMI